MKIAIISSSPNKDGLTAACAAAASEAAVMAGHSPVPVDLNTGNIGACRACNNGWGTCRETRRCQVLDGFAAAQDTLRECDAYYIVTPVYYGEMSESAKSFLDRLRRCEASGRTQGGHMQGKYWILTAAAGGGGGGTLSCLTSLERLVSHLGGTVFDYIPITRKSRSYKLKTIADAVEALCAL